MAPASTTSSCSSSSSTSDSSSKSSDHESTASSIFPPPPQKPLREPYPWLWVCPRCRRIYRLGVTSRCLVCTTQRFRAKPDPRSDEPYLFDDDGWRDHNMWRRELALRADFRRRSRLSSSPTGVTKPTPLGPLSSQKVDRRSSRAATQGMVRFLGRKTRQLARARQQAYADRLMRQLDNSTKNCFHDCDFPGECFYQQNAGFENSESEAESDAPSLTLISDGRKGTNALDDSAEDFEIWVDPTDGDAQSPDERAETECHVSAAANFIE